MIDLIRSGNTTFPKYAEAIDNDALLKYQMAALHEQDQKLYLEGVKKIDKNVNFTVEDHITLSERDNFTFIMASSSEGSQPYREFTKNVQDAIAYAAIHAKTLKNDLNKGLSDQKIFIPLVSNEYPNHEAMRIADKKGRILVMLNPSEILAESGERTMNSHAVTTRALSCLVEEIGNHLLASKYKQHWNDVDNDAFEYTKWPQKPLTIHKIPENAWEFMGPMISLHVHDIPALNAAIAIEKIEISGTKRESIIANELSDSPYNILTDTVFIGAGKVKSNYSMSPEQILLKQALLRHTPYYVYGYNKKNNENPPLSKINYASAYGRSETTLRDSHIKTANTFYDAFMDFSHDFDLLRAVLRSDTCRRITCNIKHYEAVVYDKIKDLEFDSATQMPRAAFNCALEGLEILLKNNKDITAWEFVVKELFPNFSFASAKSEGYESSKDPYSLHSIRNGGIQVVAG